MTTCEQCGGKITPGVFHACAGQSLHAPWLKEMLVEANRPLLDELGKIRELLEKQDPLAQIKKHPEASIKSRLRETR